MGQLTWGVPQVASCCRAALCAGLSQLVRHLCRVGPLLGHLDQLVETVERCDGCARLAVDLTRPLERRLIASQVAGHG